MLLPEEPAPELGVKSTGLHFLTAGDQGVWAGHGQEGAGARDPMSQRPCACTGVLRVWEAASGRCVHAQQRLPGPGGADPLRLARVASLLLSVTADHNLSALRCSLPAAAETGAGRSAPARPWPQRQTPPPSLPPLTQPATCPPPAPQFAKYSEEVLMSSSLGPKTPTLPWPLAPA